MMSQPVELTWGWRGEGDWGRRLDKIPFSSHPPKQAAAFSWNRRFGSSQNQNCSLLAEQNKGAGGETLLKTGRRFGNNHRRVAKPLYSWDSSAELQNILSTLYPHPDLRLHAQDQEQGYSERNGKVQKDRLSLKIRSEKSWVWFIIFMEEVVEETGKSFWFLVSLQESKNRFN